LSHFSRTSHGDGGAPARTAYLQQIHRFSVVYEQDEC
jgi:hypothetical protein